MILETNKLPSTAKKEKMWEQRRYEIARDMLTMLSTVYDDDTEMALAVEKSIDYADELIKQLKSRQAMK